MKMTTRICPEDITVEKLFVFQSRFNPKSICNLFLGEQQFERNKYVPRWKAFGNSIPFPVWNGTWFMGLPEKNMVEYMSSCGYQLISKTPLGHLPTREAFAAVLNEKPSLLRR